MYVAEAPVFLRRICGHVAVVNSKALEIAGIGPGTPDPPGGRIVRDERTGEPNGILEEKAMDLIVQYLPLPSEDEVVSVAEEMLGELKRIGITSIQDQSDSIAYAAYAQLLEEDSLTCRISMWMPLQADLSKAKRMRSKYRGNMLHAGLLKEVVDGSLGSRTASLFHPYSDAPETDGLVRLTQNELNLLVLNADREDFQIGVHAIGDRANRMALDAFELARELNGQRDSRHRIEHAQVLSPEDIPRFFKLGVIASMQPSHCITDLPWAEHRLGTQRSLTAYAWNDLLSSGATLAFGTDWPSAPLNPMIGLYAAVMRRDTTGYPPEGWFPRQRIGLEDAIKAYTLGSAFAEFEESMKGSLEAGKLADIVVFDRNLLNAPPQDILRAKVIYTILGGKIIYKAVPADD
jgi:predicted amidohydrolase YtcJ